MTAINLVLRNFYGYVVWGNSLGNEKRLVYRIGLNLRGVVREIPVEDCPAPVRKTAAESPASPAQSTDDGVDEMNHDEATKPPGKQLRLF